MSTSYQNDNNDKWWVAAIIVVIALFMLNAFSARAQKLDTLRINPSCITKVIEKKTPKSTRYYAVYNDGEKIQDIIPIGKTVLEYVQVCRENQIKPSLGIKLKDGRITSIVKLQRRYETRSIHKAK